MNFIRWKYEKLRRIRYSCTISLCHEIFIYFLNINSFVQFCIFYKEISQINRKADKIIGQWHAWDFLHLVFFTPCIAKLLQNLKDIFGSRGYIFPPNYYIWKIPIWCYFSQNKYFSFRFIISPKELTSFINIPLFSQILFHYAIEILKNEIDMNSRNLYVATKYLSLPRTKERNLFNCFVSFQSQESSHSLDCYTNY